MNKRNLLKKFKKRYCCFFKCLTGCVLLLVLWLIIAADGHIFVFSQTMAEILSSENLALVAFAGIMIIMPELAFTSHKTQWKFHTSYYFIVVLLYYAAAALWVREWNWFMAVPLGVYLWRLALPFKWMRELNDCIENQYR